MQASDAAVGLLAVTDLVALQLAPSRGRRLQYRVKRVVDVVLSVLGLILLSPFLLAIILAVTLSSPGPVFFVQERLAMGGKSFRLLKFRTMTDGAARRADE